MPVKKHNLQTQSYPFIHSRLHNFCAKKYCNVICNENSAIVWLLCVSAASRVKAQTASHNTDKLLCTPPLFVKPVKMLVSRR